jgi:LmbE family N-acetylglucosaminyl deacetylase
MIELDGGTLSSVAVVGAHCDDIAIGAGATLLTLARAVPGLEVNALVMSGDTERADEEAAALNAFCPGAKVELTVLDHADGRLPASWNLVKDQLSKFRRTCDPQAVFAPQREDFHQDHRLIGELMPTEFRDHLVLGYEILKWESDLPNPTLYHPISDDIAQLKVELLQRHYPSQAAHDWFDRESFLGLMRIRGVQCRNRYAEAFVVEKATIAFGATLSQED